MGSVSAKAKFEGKLSESKKEQESKALFDKYDKDLDGKLDQHDIVAFAKEEYSFEPTEDKMEKIMKAIGSDGGVPYEQLRRLRSMLAIAKAEAGKKKEGAADAAAETEAVVCE